MNLDQNEEHATQVDAWLERTADGLPSDRLIRLFEEAIRALQRRTLVTLSEVTLTAIFDRVLYQSQKHYPLLSGLKIETDGISLDGLRSEVNRLKPAQLTEAFRFFLIELLTIFGNLSAGILTELLYRELSKVTAEQVSTESDAASPGSKHRKTRTNREDV